MLLFRKPWREARRRSWIFHFSVCFCTDYSTSYVCLRCEAVWWVFAAFCFLATRLKQVRCLLLNIISKRRQRTYPKRVLKSCVAMPCTQVIVRGPFLCARTILLLTCFCLHWTESCMNCQEGCRWCTPRLTGSRNIIFRLPKLMHFNQRQNSRPSRFTESTTDSDVSTHESMNVSNAITIQNNTK